LSEAHFLLHGWLRSGNCGTSRGVEEFLKEALALWGQREKIQAHLKSAFAALPASVKKRYGRADSGFYCKEAVESYEEHDCRFVISALRSGNSVGVAAGRVGCDQEEHRHHPAINPTAQNSAGTPRRATGPRRPPESARPAAAPPELLLSKQGD